MNEHLQQIKCNTKLFGGIIVVLIGDTGQLPSILGKVIWETDPKSRNDTSGLRLYKQFQTVITLTENFRIHNHDKKPVFYDKILIILRDGRFSLKDYNHIKKNCSNHSLAATEFKMRGFSENNVTSLFSSSKKEMQRILKE